MIFQRKYGVALAGEFVIEIPMIKFGAVGHAASADWTPAAGDVMVKVGTAAWANIATLPTAQATGGNGGKAVWQFTLSAAELTAKQTKVMVNDAAAGQGVEDNGFLVETFGHPFAMYPSDPTANNLDAEKRFTGAVVTNILGTVGTGSTTTSIVVSSLDPAAVDANQFKGLVLKFKATTTTAGLRGQGAAITANTTGATPTLTVDALSSAPVSGDEFTIT